MAFFLKLASFFNPKLKAGVTGRKSTFNLIQERIQKDDAVLWFHCASLGEYEQGLPVFEAVKELYANHKTVLTFFSPSGYDVRKNSSIADVVVYLPLDTKKNAKKFLRLVHPNLTIFVKYDIWPNYLSELKNRGNKVLLISALFRKDQIYFKSYGHFMRRALRSFDHIFVQNNASKDLLNTYNITQVTVSGDTRFDRVSRQLEMDNTLEIVAKFKQDKLCLVAGSTWPEDERLLIDLINNASDDIKFIIAPHNIKPIQIDAFVTKLTKPSVLYTKHKADLLQESQVLILDTIGTLSKVYAYADMAYVGGAIGTTGLHNTLEPAVFGIPIIIGPNHDKFPEAKTMIENGGMFVVTSSNELQRRVQHLHLDAELRTDAGRKNAIYVKKNAGAVIQIVSFLRKYA